MKTFASAVVVAGLLALAGGRIADAGATVVLSVPWVGQSHPLDCEAAALQAMLAYQGVQAGQDQILAAMGDDPRAGYYDSAGRLRWGNAYQVFVGNVNGSEVDLTGYGTFWPVVARVANQLGGGTVYQAGAGISPATVYSLVAGGHPVQTWVTFDWAAHARHDYLTFDGSTWIPWAGPVEHSVDVIGVSDSSVYISDPDGGKGIPGHNYPRQYWLAKSTFEAAYAVYGDMAVATGRAPASPAVSACAGQSSATVSWAPPASYGTAVTGYTVILDPGGQVQQLPASARLAAFDGLSPGTQYTAQVTATDLFGTSPASTTDPLVPHAGPALATSYFSWYDLSSPTVGSDNLHVLNRPGSGGPSVGCALVPGMAVAPFDVVTGEEQVLSFPRGTIGGPVALLVYSGPDIAASQRVEFDRSFNEIAAQPASAAASNLQFAWYDRKSSPGFLADNIHVFNPGSASAAGSVSIPGCAAQPLSVRPGQEQVFTCAGGFGGPALVNASSPVLASQRVQYYQSFNEEWAQPAGAAAGQILFNWYDHASSPGFKNDNLHVWNPGSGPATGTVAIPGCTDQHFSLPAGAEQIFNCGQGYGGPATVSASTPILASQRVQYYQSFNEVPAAGAAAAAERLYFTWFDHASDFGFAADNVHVIHPTGPLSPGDVTVAIPGCSPDVWQAAPSELVYSCPFGSGVGGPVTVTSTVGVVASQRVQFYQSFNEVPALP